MKTEQQIRLDLHQKKEESKIKGKILGKVAENHYLTAIKTIQVLNQEEVKKERLKLIEIITVIESKWDSYLNNFTAFKLKHPDTHKKAVRKEFKKVYELTKINSKLKWINYVLNYN